MYLNIAIAGVNVLFFNNKWAVRQMLCVCFVDRYFSFCPFSFVHCVICLSSINGFWFGILKLLQQ
jgi:hypothetical protein